MEKHTEQFPLVTIFSPTYNHENFIEQTLNGFLRQIINFPIEIIIYDDHSSDSTSSILMEYEAQYPRIIKTIHQKTNQYSLGKGIFREFCLPNAKGQYIALCDGDDYWTDPLKLQKQIDFLENNPEFAACAHNTKILYADNQEESLIVSSAAKDVFTIDDFTKGEAYFHTSSMVYRNDANNKKAFDMLKQQRGDWFIQLVYSQFGPIKYLDEVMSVYRIHEKGVWTQLNSDQQMTKNLKGIMDFNRIFDYRYEENFLNLFTRVSTNTFHANNQTVKNILDDLSETDLKKVLYYMYRKTEDQSTLIDQQNCTISEQNTRIAEYSKILENINKPYFLLLYKLAKKIFRKN